MPDKWPYMLLYEQIIQSYAKQIAAAYTVDQAANELRHPFWDWALNAVPPDQVIALRQVTITGSNGNVVTVDNPLYHYAFHPIDPSFPRPASLWKTTLRQPTNAKDNVDRLRAVLQSAQSDVTSSIYNMLTRVHEWPAFSNHTPGDGGSTSNSLEAIHDGIHVDVGGAGEMSNPAVAAYDPIFFCDVDRMLQLWSALNPGVWVTQSDAETGTFRIPASTPVDENTHFNGLNLDDPQAVQTAIAEKVNQLYGSSIFGLTSLAASASAVAATTERAVPVQVLSAVQPASTEQTPQVPVEVASNPPLTEQAPQVLVEATSKPFYDWTCRIEFKKYELNSSFAVLIFLGDVPDDPLEWRSSPTYVGAHYAFVNSHVEECENCRSQGPIVIEGFVRLNTAIIAKAGPDLSPEIVEPYLKQNLQWRVQKADGEVASLTSLEVTVYETPISYPPGTILPVYRDRICHGSITHGVPVNREPTLQT